MGRMSPVVQLSLSEMTMGTFNGATWKVVD